MDTRSGALPDRGGSPARSRAPVLAPRHSRRLRDHAHVAGVYGDSSPSRATHTAAATRRTHERRYLSARVRRSSVTHPPALHEPAGQLRCLLDPTRHEFLIDRVVLADVEVAHVLLLGLAGGKRTQRCAAEEAHLHVPVEAVNAEEPAVALGAVEGRVPLHRLAHVGDRAFDERVEAAADVVFPSGHGRDVVLDGDVPVALMCNLITGW